MTRAALLLLLCASLFFALTPACYAVPLPTASTDQVPTGNWSYYALMHLAAKGFVPGESAQRFMGDWLYNREDMARFVLLMASVRPDAMNEKDHALLSRLAAEYEPEIRVIAGDKAFESLNAYELTDANVPVGEFDGRAVRTSGDNDLLGLYRVAGMALPGRYVTLAVTGTNLRREFEGDQFSQLDTFSARGKTPNWEWEIGKDYMWWGPGYSGSMILSDNSPSFPMLKIGKDFYFGQHIGYVKVTEFISSFDDGNKTAYLVGRRWEKRFSPLFHIGINETAKTTKAPNPLVLVIPSLYLYQHIYTTQLDVEWNSFLSFDMSYQPSQRFEGYFDFLIDDMKAPVGLRTGPAWDLPRKIGYLVGGYWPDVVGEGRLGLRAEYIFTDPGTYAATRSDFPELAYTHDGLVIGHPVGGNSSAIFLRVDSRFAPKWAGAIQYLGRVPQDKNGPNPNNTYKFSALLSRDIFPSFSITARYDLQKLPEKIDRFQLGASYAF